MINITVVQD